MPPDAADCVEVDGDAEGAAPHFRMAFPAGSEAVRQALLRLRGELPRLGLAEPEIGTAEIVLAELLNNIVEHAYDPGAEGGIELECERRKTRLVCTISDGGGPMPGDRLPEKGLAATDVARQDLPEGGFGWFLIRELVEELSYARQDGKNIVRFGLGLGRPASEA
ncbi:ATP-binding protein [Mangrovicoccus sp. HB161399]|uniref:ATP-binding protein n=1 Tax=Mangrovicoccus sp. HB161399 TaxID=2720392 RepID=UPI0020A6BFBA|nr:ATP-binding protein [Mangrovicoccus sp. HB161399]